MPPPPAVPDPPDAEQRWRPGRGDSAGELLRWWLSEQARAILAAEGAGGGASDVHDLRVAMRRARSALATFRPLVDASRTEPLRAELQWAASELGRVRDAEVVLERVSAHEPTAAAAGADASTTGPSRRGHRALVRALGADLDARRPEVAAVLSSRRYRSALAGLEAMAADPPLTEAAHAPARRVARRRVRHEADRFDRFARLAFAETDPDRRAALLHEARKAAKRLRYAAEAAGPVTGPRVLRLAGAAEELQDLLGEHHDTVASRAAVTRLAASGDPATAFAAGRVHALEEAQAQRLEEVAEAAVRRLDRRSGV